MTKIIEFETERLKLRQWQQSDYAIFAKLNADEEVMRYYPATLTKLESDALAKKIEALIASRGWGFWAVELKTTHEFIGFVGLHEPGAELPFTPCVEIGWRLVKEYWGHGYATEAAQKALQFAFENLCLNEVVSFTSLINKPSQAVMQRLRMSDTGMNFDHPSVPEGSQLKEHVLYKITRPQWVDNI